MKLKNITILSMTLIVASGCAERYTPDELTVLKYKPLAVPEKLELVKPIKGKKSLGHIEPRDIIAEQTLAFANTKNYDNILKKFKIKNIDDKIRAELEKPTGKAVIVDIKEEQKRIKQNLAQGKSLTYGKTPSIDTRYTKSGVEELFGD